jgi:hypothetical protein
MTMTLASPTNLLAIAQPATYSTKQEKMPKSLSLVPNQKDTFSVKPRKADEAFEETVKPQTAEKPSLLPLIVAGVLGLSGLVMGIYGLVQHNKSRELLEKSAVDKKTIQALEATASKAIEMGKENLDKLQEEYLKKLKPQGIATVNEIITKYKSLPMEGEYLAKLLLANDAEKKHKEITKELEDAIQNLEVIAKKLHDEQNSPQA